MQVVVILFSVPKLEWPGGPLFELNSNKHWGQNAAAIRVILWAIIKVKPGALGQILQSPGNHKWAPEQKYLPSNQNCNGLGRDHYSSGTQINAGGQTFGHYSSYPQTIIEVRPGALDQILHPPEDQLWDT